MAEFPTRRTIDERIKDRLSRELKTHKILLNDRKIIDRVLENTTERIDEHVKAIAEVLKEQQAAVGHSNELTSQYEDLAIDAGNTATIGINLSDVFFRSDINLLEKHLNLAESEVITLALTHDPELLDRIKDIIERIDKLDRGLSKKDD